MIMRQLISLHHFVQSFPKRRSICIGNPQFRNSDQFNILALAFLFLEMVNKSRSNDRRERRWMTSGKMRATRAAQSLASCAIMRLGGASRTGQMNSRLVRF
jgi:hypothetical protein